MPQAERAASLQLWYCAGAVSCQRSWPILPCFRLKDCGPVSSKFHFISKLCMLRVSCASLRTAPHLDHDRHLCMLESPSASTRPSCRVCVYVPASVHIKICGQALVVNLCSSDCAVHGSQFLTLRFQVAVTLCVPALACLALWACMRPPTPSIMFAAAITAVYTAGIIAVRTFLLELQYQVRHMQSSGVL